MEKSHHSRTSLWRPPNRSTKDNMGSNQDENPTVLLFSIYLHYYWMGQHWQYICYFIQSCTNHYFSIIKGQIAKYKAVNVVVMKLKSLPIHSMKHVSIQWGSIRWSWQQLWITTDRFPHFLHLHTCHLDSCCSLCKDLNINFLLVIKRSRRRYLSLIQFLRILMSVNVFLAKYL